MRHAGEWIGPSYATRSLSTGQFLRVPCIFADFVADRQLVDAIRFALERQREGLD
jgi:hypothetical protein